MAETIFHDNQKQGASVLGTVKNGYKHKLTAEQQQALAEMVKKKSDLQMDYIDFPAKHAKWSSYADTQAQVDKQNRMYYVALLGICAVPLRHGVDAHSIATCLGMYAGICMVSSGFRKNIKGIVGEVMLPYYDQIHDMFPNSKFAKLVDKVLPDKNQLLIEKNYGRLPLTPETAAMQKLGWIEKAYKDMRVPGADEETVMRQYNDACRALDDLCERDGVSKEEMSQKMQAFMMMRIQENPQNERFYAELDNGSVTLSTQDVVEENPDGSVNVTRRAMPTEVDGKRAYCFYKGKNTSYDGDFSPRRPSQAESHSQKMGEICQDYCRTVKDYTDLGYELQLSNIQFRFRDNVEFSKFCDDLESGIGENEDFYQNKFGMSKDDYLAGCYDLVCNDITSASMASWILQKDKQLSDLVSSEKLDAYDKMNVGNELQQNYQGMDVLVSKIREHEANKAQLGIYGTYAAPLIASDDEKRIFDFEGDTSLDDKERLMKRNEANRQYLKAYSEAVKQRWQYMADGEYGNLIHSDFATSATKEEPTASVQFSGRNFSDENDDVSPDLDVTPIDTASSERVVPKFTEETSIEFDDRVLGHFTYSPKEFELKSDKQGQYLYYIGRATEGRNIEIPQGIKSCRCMFKDRQDVVSAPEIPNGVEDCSEMFSRSGIETPPKIPGTVRNCQYMFSECTSLTRVPAVPSSVTQTNGMFSACKTSIQKQGDDVIKYRNKDYEAVVDLMVHQKNNQNDIADDFASMYGSFTN